MAAKITEYGLSLIGEHDSTDVLFLFTEDEAKVAERIVNKVNASSRNKQQPTMELVKEPEGPQILDPHEWD